MKGNNHHELQYLLMHQFIDQLITTFH